MSKMLKFVFVVCVVVALMQQTEAFKVVTIQKDVPAVDPAVLIQGVQSAIAGKLGQVQALVGSLIEQKKALKQNALNSLQGTLGGLKNQIGSLARSVHPPFVIRKHIIIGVPKSAAPDSTTALDVDATTFSE